MGSTIKASKEKVLLGVRYDNDLTFKEHVTSICSKTNQKLHALTRVLKYLRLQTHHILIKSFITTQFSYCPIVWMCHDRSLNSKVNRIHEMALRISYQDFQSTFSALLVKNNSFTMHQKNLQLLAIEIFKVKINISPEFLERTTLMYEGVVTVCLDQTSILRNLGLSILRILLLKYEMKYLTKSKKHAPLQF